MSRLGIFVYKSNKKSSTSIAVGKIIAENSSRIEIETKDDPKQAVFSVIKKFQEDGIIISEIVINGTENYFRKTPFESNVIVLKRPELFFPSFIELKKNAREIRKKIQKNNINQPIITIPKTQITTKKIGDHAEDVVTEYLINHGHKIIARNHKTKFYEIDIISLKEDRIYFTEVKYRKNESRGTTLDMITKKKKRQMAFAAEMFLSCHNNYKENYSPLLAAASVSGGNFVFKDWIIIA